MSDRVVLGAAVGDDRFSMVAGWFDRYVDDIYGYAARRVGAETARDVTSETFRVALERFDTFDPAVVREPAAPNVTFAALDRYGRVIWRDAVGATRS